MDDTHDLFGWVGATVDAKYRVDAVVGQGGFGVVYRAHHLGFEQTVALKCLRLPQTLSNADRERFRETFLAEGRLLHQLSRASTGIVQALDLGAAVSPNKHWTPYLVLEWLEGTALDKDFATRRAEGHGGRTPREALRLLKSAARGLAVAHAQGIAHRDIKPANLFLANLAGKNVTKVLDFGIAKVMSESESVTRAFEETGGSTQAFTARYGAPEQFSRRYGATGPWTDVFALALVFVEAVTGKPALDGQDAAQLFVAAADEERRPTLRALGVPTSDTVEAVLARALAVDPRVRFGSAGEFWDALEAAVKAGDPRDENPSLADADPGSAVSAINLTAGSWPRSGDSVPADSGTPPATDLSTSNVRSVESANRPAGSGFRKVAVLGAALAVMGGSLTLAVGLFVTRSRNPHPAPAAVPALSSSSKPLISAAPPALPPEQPTESVPTPIVPPILSSQDEAAPPEASAVPLPVPAPAPAPNRPPPLGGLPARDVSAGPVGRGYIGGYRLLAREAAVGLDFFDAAKQCTDVGMTLCSESQWIHACSLFPEIGAVPSWTSTVKSDRVVVRGGESCAKEDRAAPVERALSRYGMCCDRAIAMTTDNLQKPYLVTTAGRILAIERALNQRNVQALLEIAEPTVTVDDQPKNATELKRSIESDFKAAPELVVLNDTCEVSVKAKKVVKPAPHRKKKIVYQTQGWTAECDQTALLPASVSGRHITYAFSAASKLREIVAKTPE